MSSAKSRERLTFIAITAIIILLAANAVLLYNKYNQDQVINEQKEEIYESKRLQSELEKEYYEALAEMEEMRGDNESMNTLIDEQKADLKVERDRIRRLITENRDLTAAKTELGQLKIKVDQYLAKIDQLEAENAVLSDANYRLETERQLLTTNLAEERQVNDELKSVKATLIEEKESLESENTNLENKVELASVVMTNNLLAEGYKEDVGGKLRKRNKAKNIQLVQVCFDASENSVTETDEETFHMRIIDPAGETMAVESLGSGVFTRKDTGEEIRYTQASTFDYENQLMRVCIRWRPNLPFQAGEYQVEVFNKGYLAGTGSFVLK